MKAIINLNKIIKIALVTTNCKKTVAQVKVEQNGPEIILLQRQR